MMPGGTTTVLDFENPVIEFSALDRCDQCGAQAYTQAERIDQPAALLFCWHHRQAHEDKLLEDGWTLVDDNAALENLFDNRREINI